MYRMLRKFLPRFDTFDKWKFNSNTLKNLPLEEKYQQNTLYIIMDTVVEKIELIYRWIKWISSTVSSIAIAIHDELNSIMISCLFVNKPWKSFYRENPVSFYINISSQIFTENYVMRDIVRDIIKLLSWKINIRKYRKIPIPEHTGSS